jgi:hypothetical protein
MSVYRSSQLRGKCTCPLGSACYNRILCDPAHVATFLVCAYKYGVEEFARDHANKLYIPVHLDTRALGPILSFMQWRSRRFDVYGLDTPRKGVIATGTPQMPQTPNGF